MMNTIQRNIAAALAALLPAVALAAGNPAEGQKKSAACHACHGETGASVLPSYPHLGGQHADYLEKALRDFRSGQRQNPIMSGFAAGLSDADIADIAAWYASQRGLTEIADK